MLFTASSRATVLVSGWGGSERTAMTAATPLTVDERLALVELEVGDLVAREERRHDEVQAIRSEIDDFRNWRLELEQALLSAA